MLLRVLLVLLVGVALARPQFRPPHRTIARVLAVDLSRAVGNPTELADSAGKYFSDATAVILFDAAGREVTRRPGDSIAAFATARRSFAAPRGSLSAALITARRAAARLRDGADSLELVIVSPFAEEERDAATIPIRALWPGRITTVRVSSAAVPSSAGPVKVEWADSSGSVLWARRPRPDTVTAVRAGDAVMVHPFVRRWQAAVEADSATRVYARWVDGEPAAFERMSPTQCIRTIAIPLPTSGDALLRPGFQRFLSSLVAPCGHPMALAPLPSSFMEIIRGIGPLVATGSVERQDARATPVAPWLLGVAALLALVEITVRRRHATRRRFADERSRRSSEAA